MDEVNNKIKCNCPCPGPFCSKIVHPCQKPDEHMSQWEEASNEIRAEYRKELREKINTLKSVYGDYGDEGYQEACVDVLKLLEDK